MPYLCFDVGTSVLKAGVVSEGGELCGFAHRPLSSLHGKDGSHESDARSWVDAAFGAGREALSVDEPRVGIRALAVSGNGPSLLPVDDYGMPLGPALSWLDRRSVAEAAEVSALTGEEIDPTFYLPKALRLWRSGDQNARRRIRWFFSCPEYLAFRLCGEAATYLPHPAYQKFIWNDFQLDALALPRERFPPFVTSGKILGELLPEAARRLGLEPGIPVVAGFPDFLASILGSGAVEVGIACDRTGTSEAINICSDRPFSSPVLFSLPHPVHGLWNISGGLSSAGSSLECMASASGLREAPTAPNAIDSLVAEASRVAPGANGLVFLPYLSGERAPIWDPDRRGAFVGLALEHGRSEIARAACESIAYGLRLAIDLAQAERHLVDSIRVSGYLGTIELLCEIKADILGIPVDLPSQAECELIGDSIACALALGDASDLAEASRSIIRIKKRFEPRSDDRYRAAYDKFKAALVALSPVDSSLAQLASSSPLECQ